MQLLVVNSVRYVPRSRESILGSARAIEHPPTKNKEDEGKEGKDNCHCSH